MVAFAASVHATPIDYISATTVPTSFTPTGGDFGLGVLSLSGTRPLILHYANSQEVLDGSQFLLTAYLKEDNSTPVGEARGLFEGGVLRLLNSSGNELLVGEAHSVLVGEFLNDRGMFTTSGTFTVTGGLLMQDFGRNGQVFELMFNVQPITVSDFKSGFSGLSDLSLTAMVPEPITLGILGIGLAGLVARRRRS